MHRAVRAVQWKTDHTHTHTQNATVAHRCQCRSNAKSMPNTNANANANANANVNANANAGADAHANASTGVGVVSILCPMSTSVSQSNSTPMPMLCQFQQMLKTALDQYQTLKMCTNECSNARVLKMHKCTNTKIHVRAICFSLRSSQCVEQQPIWSLTLSSAVVVVCSNTKVVDNVFDSQWSVGVHNGSHRLPCRHASAWRRFPTTRSRSLCHLVRVCESDACDVM